jgi:hypothetical protein
MQQHQFGIKQESEKCPKKSTAIAALFWALLSMTIAQCIPVNTPPRETEAEFFSLF